MNTWTIGNWYRWRDFKSWPNRIKESQPQIPNNLPCWFRLASYLLKCLQLTMYKRYARELKKTQEDSSSGSDSEYEQESLAYPNRSNSSSSEDESIASEEETGSVSAQSEDSDSIIETSVLTMEELEAGDEKATTKPKRGQELLYQCSLCPQKRLSSLTEVQTHIVSKVCLLILVLFHKKTTQNLMFKIPNSAALIDPQLAISNFCLHYLILSHTKCRKCARSN